MFLNVYLAENRKLFKRAMLWVEIGILALLVAFFLLIIFVQLQNPPADMAPPIIELLRRSITWPGAMIEMLELAAGNALGGLLVIVLVGAVTAQEYGWRTIHLWLSHGTPRLTFLLARFASFGLPLLLLAATPVLVAGTLSIPLTLQLDGSVEMEGLLWGGLLMSVLRTAYTLLPYAALTFFLAIVTRSAVAAIGGGVAYALLLESVAVALLPLAGSGATRLAQALPASMASSLLVLNEEASGMAAGLDSAAVGGPMVPPVEPWVALAAIAAYTLFFLALAALRFRQQDLTG